MPLHVEILYNEYNYTAAFAVASLLALLALLTLAGKSFMEWRQPELRRATHLPRDGRGRDRTRRVNT
jgi:sulfate transport system permease protein